MAEDSAEKMRELEEQLHRFARDLSTLYADERKKRESLHITLRQLEAVFDGVPNPIVSTDHELKLVRSNRAFEQFPYLTDKPEQGTLLPQLLRGSAWRKLFKALSPDQPQQDIIINPDQKGFNYYRVHWTTYSQSNNQPSGYTFIFFDISIEHSLRTIGDDIISITVDKAKDELRSLHQMISTYGSMMKKVHSEEQLEIFSLIYESISNIDNYFDEFQSILDLLLSREQRTGRVDLRVLVDEIVSAINELAPVKERVSIIAPHNEPLEWIGSVHLLRRVLSFLGLVVIGISSEKSQITIKFRPSKNACHLKIFISQLRRKFVELGMDDALNEKQRYYFQKSLKLLRATHGIQFYQSFEDDGGCRLTLTIPLSKDETGKLLEEVSTLKQQVVELEEMNIRYAQSLANTYSEHKKTTFSLEKTNEQLLRSEKLATLGRMLAGVTHEMRNRLNPVTVYCELLLREKKSLSEKMVKRIEIMKESALRAVDMLQQTLDFSRSSQAAVEIFPLIPQIDKTLSFLQYELKKSKTGVHCIYPDDPIFVNLNKGEFDQIVTNLIYNARDAMPDGGTLTIRVTKGAEQQESTTVPWVSIQFEDTGVGMSEEVRERVFEPFFSTKKEGQGTGLGLYILHTLVDKHGGTIDVESTLGQGTTFTLKFPAVEP